MSARRTWVVLATTLTLVACGRISYDLEQRSADAGDAGDLPGIDSGGVSADAGGDAGPPRPGRTILIQTTGRDAVWDLALDSSDTLYFSGSYGGALDLGGSVGVVAPLGIQDSVVASYDAAGALRWAWTPGMSTYGQALGLGLSSDGLAVTGMVSGMSTRGGHAIASTMAQDVFLATFALDGAARRVRIYGGTRNQQGHGLSVTADGATTAIGGNYVDVIDFGGTGLPSATVDQCFVVVLDPGGGERWSRAILASGPSCRVNDVAFAPDSSVCIVMTFAGSVGTGAPPPAYSSMPPTTRDAIVARYDRTGTWLWQREVSTPLDDNLVTVSTAPDGDCVVGGTVTGAPTFAETGALGYAGGSTDAFAARFAAETGAVRWANTWGGAGEDSLGGVATDASGNAYVVGSFQGTASLPGVQATATGVRALFAASLASDGAVRWERTIGGPGQIEAGGPPAGITATPDGTRVALSAEFSGSIVVDGVTIVGRGGPDAFIYWFSPL